jgi:hypothetical protein
MYSKKINTYNSNHLGDTIFCFICFYHIKNYIEENNIQIFFFCNDINIHQLSEFNYSSNNISILPIEHMPKNEEMHDLWIGQSIEYNYYDEVCYRKEYFDVFLSNFYNIFLTKINIPIKIGNFIYDDASLYARCYEINYTTNNKYRNIDFLFNNSRPCSGQIDYNEYEWDNFAIELSKKYNIVTTKKVGEIKCTIDDNLTVRDIAAISTGIKKFILLGNGVAAGLMNNYMIHNAEIVYYLCGRDVISFANFINKTHINEMAFLLQ